MQLQKVEFFDDEENSIEWLSRSNYTNHGADKKRDFRFILAPSTSPWRKERRPLKHLGLEPARR
jgi:hypothetical protein